MTSRNPMGRSGPATAAEEMADPAAAVDADPLRAAWIEASDRYDDLLHQQDADPDAPLGQRVTAAYWARQGAFGAMHERRPTDAAIDSRLSQACAAGNAAKPAIEGSSANCVCPLPYSPGGEVPCMAAGQCMRAASSARDHR